MSKFAVISDSACDLPASAIERASIDVVPFKISFDKVNKLAEGINISNDEFYRKLEASSAMPKTYFPTVGDYVAQFKKRLEQGQDVLCLCLSSKISKSYESAQNAKKILSYTYPNNRIMIVDTLMASAGQALLVLDAVKLSDSYDIAAACEKLEETKKSAYSIVTVASLEQLARGGRISSTSAALGKLLKINPIIYMRDGVLTSKGKAYGRSKALKLVGRLTFKEMNGNPADFDFAMLHSRALSEANALGREMEALYGVRQTISPIEVGAAIGMHTGASVVATAFAKKL